MGPFLLDLGEAFIWELSCQGSNMSDWKGGAGARDCFSFKLISNKTHSPGNHPSKQEGSNRIPWADLAKTRVRPRPSLPATPCLKGLPGGHSSLVWANHPSKPGFGVSSLYFRPRGSIGLCPQFSLVEIPAMILVQP